MPVVDASVLFDVVAGTPRSEALRQRLADDDDQMAPHLIDAEVFGVIRRHHERGWLDRTAADQAVQELRDWPGERIGHRPLLERAWELRGSVRGYDALYVALAAAIDATFVRTDGRLARAPGPRCEIVLLPR
jgi:predicted nucleic acid-binding protein